MVYPPIQTILSRFIVSILWQYEIGYRFNLSYFNFGQDWIFKRAGLGISSRPAWEQRITGIVRPAGRSAQNNAPL